MMVTRKMKNLGIDLSLLGFGCMRFPMNEGKIDELVATNMIKEAMAKGVNYIDTAYPYHNGASEPFVGESSMNMNAVAIIWLQSFLCG